MLNLRVPIVLYMNHGDPSDPSSYWSVFTFAFTMDRQHIGNGAVGVGVIGDAVPLDLWLTNCCCEPLLAPIYK
jgi:hypothetical protein